MAQRPRGYMSRVRRSGRALQMCYVARAPDRAGPVPGQAEAAQARPGQPKAGACTVHVHNTPLYLSGALVGLLGSPTVMKNRILGFGENPSQIPMENTISPWIAIQAWKRLRASRKCTVHAHITFLSLPDSLLGLAYAPFGAAGHYRKSSPDPAKYQKITGFASVITSKN